MKKLFTLLIAFIITGFVYGQTVINGNFESWTGANPDGWTLTPDGTDITFSQGTSQGVTGDALKIVANTNEAGSDGEFENTVTDIVPGNTYSVSVFVKSNDDLILIRYWDVRWLDATDTQVGVDIDDNTYNSITLDNWTEHTITGNPITAPANAVKLRVNFRVYIQTGFASGTTSMLVDSFNVKTIYTLPFTENFNTGIPAYWTIVDSLSDSWTWYGETAHSGDDLDGTPFAFVNSDDAGSVDMDEQMITPEIDASAASALILEFDHFFYYTGSEIGDVDVWDGSAWQNVYSVSGADIGDWSAPDNQIIDISAYINANLKVRFHYYDANYAWFWAVDNVKLYEPANYDVAPVEILTPQTGCGLTGSEIVSVKVANFGLLPVDSIPIIYSFDQGITITMDTICDTINPGDTTIFIFSTPADLSAPGTYESGVVTMLPTDQDNTNDSLFFEVTHIPVISAFPYTEDFEAPFTGWTSDAVSGNNDWELGMPATTNLNTTHSGLNAWVTNLSGDYNYDDDCYVLSPCFDFTSLLDPQLSVWLNIYTETNWDAMILEASTDGGTVWNNVGDSLFYNNYSTFGSVAPPRWSGYVGVWTNYKTALTGLAGQTNVKLRFRFGSDDSSNYDGIAIDDFEIHDAYAFDVALVEILTPQTGCGLTGSETVSVKVANFGLLPVDSIPIIYSFDQGITITMDTICDTINPGDTTIFIFSTPADLSAPGTYESGVVTMLPTDQDNTNDSLFFEITSLGDISLFPFTENFESGETFYFNLKSNAEADIFVDSISANASSFGLHFIGNGSSGWTGGSTDTDSTNAWVDNISHHASALTCDIDASGLGNLTLRLDLKQYSSYGTKYSWFRVLVNGTTQISDINGVYNFNPVTSSDPFETKTFNLSAYAGSTFTLTLQSACKYNDDYVFVDNINLYEPASNDVGVTDIKPLDDLCGIADDSVIVIVTNFGYSSQDTIPVIVDIETPSGPVTVNDTLFTTLNNNEFDTLIVGTINTIQAGTYNVKAYTSLSTDNAHFNDTLISSFTITIPESIPYKEDFEASAIPPSDWNTDMYLALPAAHGNISNVLYKNLWSSNQSAYAVTPKIGTVTSNTYLTFDYRIVEYSSPYNAMNIASTDSIHIMISADCGTTFNTLYTINSLNHTPTSAMTTMQFPLASYDGNDIFILFLSTSETSDFDGFYVDFDNVIVSEIPIVDLGPDTTICANNSIIFDAGAGTGYTYIWQKAPLTDTIDYSQTISVDSAGTGLSSATYIVTVTDSLTGLQATDSVVITFEICTDINDITDNSNISIYPNPCDGTFNISAKGLNSTTDLYILNVQGQVVYKEKLINTSSNYTKQFDLSDYSKGIYFIKLVNENSIQIKKIVIQ